MFTSRIPAFFHHSSLDFPKRRTESHKLHLPINKMKRNRQTCVKTFHPVSYLGVLVADMPSNTHSFPVFLQYWSMDGQNGTFRCRLYSERSAETNPAKFHYYNTTLRGMMMRCEKASLNCTTEIYCWGWFSYHARQFSFSGNSTGTLMFMF